MKILAIPATTNRDGRNRRLLEHAADLVEHGLVADAEVEILDLDEYEMPIYTEQRERDGGVPEPARRLFDQIAGSDAVMLSFAEHNGSYTAAWKNVFDWTSRIDKALFQGRRVAMFSASPGPRGGAGVLDTAVAAAPFFGAELVDSLAVGSFDDNFDDETGELVAPELRRRFEKAIGALAG